MPAVVTAPLPQQADGYSVGTLRYTGMGLVVVFGWLLWGDFCFTLMEKVMPEIYPLFLLDRLGASNTTANIFMITIPQILVVVLCPAISFRSDRTRSRWGRRIPYMTFTAPFLCLFLVGLGFSDAIAEYMQASRMPELLHITPYATTLAIAGVLVIGFSFFNDFVGSVYWYLFADVVPRRLLGQFLGLFRLVGIGADVVFRKYVFPHASTHMQWIFLGVAVLYIVGFSLMCMRVKEGEYPPVDDLSARPSIGEQVPVYFRQCFQHPIYVLFFLHSTGIALARNGLLAHTLYCKGLPNLDLQKMGSVMASVSLVTMFLTYPAGWLADKFHPLRICMVSGLLLIPAYFACFLFLRDYDSFVATTWATSILSTIYIAALIPTHVSLFPREKYGQFASANAMLRSGAVVAGGFVVGLFLDVMTASGAHRDGYRWMYFWFSSWQLFGMLCLVGVYVQWKRRGGISGYTAPGSQAERAAQRKNATTSLDVQPSGAA
jgi:MFS family permease